jgi:hypothetical protein
MGCVATYWVTSATGKAGDVGLVVVERGVMAGIPCSRNGAPIEVCVTGEAELGWKVGASYAVAGGVPPSNTMTMALPTITGATRITKGLSEFLI